MMIPSSFFAIEFELVTFEDRKKDLETSYLLARPSRLPTGLADGLGRKAPWRPMAAFAPGWWFPRCAARRTRQVVHENRTRKRTT
jgi:hypothetical protein